MLTVMILTIHHLLTRFWKRVPIRYRKKKQPVWLLGNLKFIQNLRAALVRIENKTYGICRETGKLIPAERLRAVPHATLSIEAKQHGKK